MKKHGVRLSRASITHLTIYFSRKNRLKSICNTITLKTVPLLNSMENLTTRSVERFENFEIYQTEFRLTAGLPAVRPTSTRSMAPDFSHNKGNRVRFTKLLFR